MTNAKINQAFLTATDAQTRALVLNNIAKHYGISPEQALDEVTDDGAEHLLDYVTGPARAGVSVLMKRHRLAEPAREEEPVAAHRPK